MVQPSPTKGEGSKDGATLFPEEERIKDGASLSPSLHPLPTGEGKDLERGFVERRRFSLIPNS